MNMALKVTGNIVTGISILIILAATLLFFMHIKPAAVLSGSMEPEISTGSLVLIDTKDRDIEEGDIIAFSVEDMIVTHRAVRKTPDGWVTKGDANDSEDTRRVMESEIKGTVEIWIPKAGYVIMGVRGLIT
ncbi:MAG: signal peptidase I [Firmicutes bacterium]|nr:signal peptidase I [Bacillota bacterium]